MSSTPTLVWACVGQRVTIKQSGAYGCRSGQWIVWDQQQQPTQDQTSGGVLPPLSIQDAQVIAGSLMAVLAAVWGIVKIGQLIKSL